MLLVSGLSRDSERSGAAMSTSLVGPRTWLEPSFCLPMMVKSDLELALFVCFRVGATGATGARATGATGARATLATGATLATLATLATGATGATGAETLA